MTNINLVLPEIFISLALMFFLIIGVFKKNSSNLIYNLSILSLIILLALIVNLASINETSLFNESYKIDELSTFMKILTIFSGIFVMLTSSKYLKLTKIFKIEYPVLILCSILGMMVMISSNDLIVFYMGLELQSLSLYILASFNRDNVLSSESGVKYFVLSALSSGLLLYGCSLIYGFSGSTNFILISDNLNANSYGLTFGIVFILVGLAFKISAVPFHMWAPDVYQGSPTSVTIFFAILPKIAALTVFIRFLYVPFLDLIDQWQMIMVFLSIASMLFGAVAAIGQKNLKRLIAYSSIGHMGYALIALASGPEAGGAALLVYMVIYALSQLGIFGVILSMRRRGGMVEDINELSGLSTSMPWLAVCMTALVFSVAGIPPLGGFFGKLVVFQAGIEAGLWPIVIIGIIASVISLGYYLRIIMLIWGGEKQPAFQEMSGTVALTVTTATLLVFPVFVVFIGWMMALAGGNFTFG